MTDLVVTQLGEEIAFVGNPPLVITQIGVEIAYSLIPALVITQMGIEVAWDMSAVANKGPMITMISVV